MKKIFYVPGLISAVIVPILFWYYGNQKLNEPIATVMDIGLLPKRNPKISSDKYSTYDNLNNWKNWHYKRIQIKPETAKQHSELYVSEIKKLQQRNQKETGIEFILNDKNSYGDFASILNDFSIAKHERWGLDLEKKGHLFVLVDYKDPNAKESECLLCNDLVTITDGGDFYQPEFYEDLQRNLVVLPKQTFYIIFGFLIFLNISMFSIKESFQIH